MTCFPIRRTVEEFEYMKQAKHIGKVVITQAALIIVDDGWF